MRVPSLVAATVIALGGYGCSTTAGTGEPEPEVAETTDSSGETDDAATDEEVESSESVDTGSETDDTGGSTGEDPVVEEPGANPDLSELELHGTIPEVALAVPEFGATNYDGSARNQSNLLGKPTVMWFFPMAGTPG